MVDLPPITLPVNLLELAQSNILQSLLSVFVAGMIGASRNKWNERIAYGVLFVLPTFFVIGVLLELVNSANWRILAALLLTSIGTWITAKEPVQAKK